MTFRVAERVVVENASTDFVGNIVKVGDVVAFADGWDWQTVEAVAHASLAVGIECEAADSDGWIPAAAVVKVFALSQGMTSRPDGEVRIVSVDCVRGNHYWCRNCYRGPGEWHRAECPLSRADA